MASSDSKLQQIQTHFQTLASVANSLNTASDELTRVVGILDESLKKINVGLTSWVIFSTWSDADRYTHEQIGYSKVNGKWGIALRRIYGDSAMGDDQEDGPWLFNDAPRELRLQGVDKIPELIQALSTEALNASKRIKEKTEMVQSIASVVTQINEPPELSTTHTINMSRGQVDAIVAGVRQNHKFVAELLENVIVWERGNDELRIRFPHGKEAFAALLNGPKTISAVNAIANQVLGLPMKLTVVTEPPRFPRTAEGITARSEKGRK